MNGGEYAGANCQLFKPVTDEPELRRQEREPKGVLQKNLSRCSTSVQHCW